MYAAPRRLLPLLAAIALSAAATPDGRAQTRGLPSTLDGAWVREPPPETAMRTVLAAFRPSIARLPSLLHGYAHGRIREEMTPPHRIRVSVDGDRVALRLAANDTTTIRGAVGARARTTGVEDGTRVWVRRRAGWLEVRYVGEDSELLQLFSTEPDGARLHLDHTLTGPQIVGTVRYRIDYVRAAR